MDRNNNVSFADSEYKRLIQIANDYDMGIHDMIIRAAELWDEKDDIDYHDMLGRGD